MESDETLKRSDEENCFDIEKRNRRSSILKGRKSTNRPLDESNTDVFTSGKSSRRVSFANINFVKPFASDPERTTIWDNTYEEEVNHSDSIKSVDALGPGLLNITSIMSQDQKNVITGNPFKIWENTSTTKYIHYEIAEGVKECDKENVVPVVRTMELKNSSLEIQSQTIGCYDETIYDHTDSNIELTGNYANMDFIVPKSIVEFVKNRPSQNKSSSHDTDCNMEVTCFSNVASVNKNENTVTSHKEKINKIENRTITSAEEMDFTLATEQPSVMINNDMEITTMLNNKPLCNNIPDSRLESVNSNLLSKLHSLDKTKVFSTEQNDMELTSMLYDGKQNIINVGVMDSSRTGDSSDAEMEFTSNLNGLKPILTEKQSRSDTIQQSAAINSEEVDMEFTTNLGSLKYLSNKLQATTCEAVLSNQIFVENKFEEQMECTTNLTNPANVESNLEVDMEFTANLAKCFSVGLQAFTSETPHTNQSLIRNESEDQMEFTTNRSNIKPVVGGLKVSFDENIHKHSISAVPQDIPTKINQTAVVNILNDFDMEIVSNTAKSEQFSKAIQEKTVSSVGTRNEKTNFKLSHETIADVFSNDCEVNKTKQAIQSKSVPLNKSFIENTEIPNILSRDISHSKAHDRLKKNPIDVKNISKSILEQLPDSPEVVRKTLSPVKKGYKSSDETTASAVFGEQVMPSTSSLNEIHILSNSSEISSPGKIFQSNGINIEGQPQLKLNPENKTTFQNFHSETANSSPSNTKDFEREHQSEENNSEAHFVENNDAFNLIHVEKLSDDPRETCSIENIIYSEPGKLLQSNADFLSIPKIYAVTPTTSFAMNLSNMSPCIEDTQQLIHGTFNFSKQETLGLLSKGGKVQDKTMDEHKNESTDCIDMSQAVSINNESYKLAMTDLKVMPVESNQTASESMNQDEDGHKSCWSIANEIENIIDNTTPYIVEFENSISDVKDSPVKMKLDEEKATDSLDSVDYQNYTMRSSQMVNNINKYLVPKDHDPFFEESKKRSEAAREEYLKQVSWMKSFVENYRPPKIKIMDPREYFKEESEDSSTSQMSDRLSNDEAENQKRLSMPELTLPKSLYERVHEAAKRSTKYWQFVKVENDFYHFTSFFKAVPFKVHVHPELGIVYSIETYNLLAEESRPLSHYVTKVFELKLKLENLLAALGPKFDILALLDYVCLCMGEAVSFRKEFHELLKKYGTSHKLKMHRDGRVTFEILHIKLIIWWTITIEMSLNNLGYKENITAKYELKEKVNDKDVKLMAENCPKGVNFLRSYIEKVNEYVERVGKKIAWQRESRLKYMN
ncbi:hypothetical protein JTB14_011451 [Gonioctena quinquepunctata]|nr:hypothetical protein JTB14_011451 [Gonioctena quinquepunctata]